MYGKLFASLYQGTLRGQSDAILVFTNMIAYADSAGFVDKHPLAIADETGISVDRVRAAIAILMAPDPESRSHENDGKRLVLMDEHRTWGWLIVNYAKYRAIRSEEDRREQNRRSQERYRNRNKPQSAIVSRGKPRSAIVSRGKPRSAQAEAEAEAEERNTYCSEVGKQPSEPVFNPKDCKFPIFPCAGDVKTWRATENQLAELAEAYPGIDVLAEHRKAHLWVMSNLNKRKTAKRYFAYLNTWFARAQNSRSTPSFSGKQVEDHKAVPATSEQIAEMNRLHALKNQQMGVKW